MCRPDATDLLGNIRKAEKRKTMDLLSAFTVQDLLHTRRLGQSVRCLSQVDSTNAALWRLVERGAAEGTVLIADAQTAGRGRLGKTWFSPPGVNLHLSILLTPPIQLHEARLLTLIGSLAVADAIEAEGATAQVKWPNDVLVADKKVAGVLADVKTLERRVHHLILGIGINVNINRRSITQLFGDAAAGATSLYEVLGHEVDRARLAARLLENLEKHYFAFLASGKAGVLQEWRRRSFLGCRVQIKEEDIRVEGIALDLDNQGCLVVLLDGGATVRVREGEVMPLGTRTAAGNVVHQARR
jgi:BirA family transcriptional regulator, biotin operon repressor / biotin---[acetyl-CoA-carboxylase] ligase